MSKAPQNYIQLKLFNLIFPTSVSVCFALKFSEIHAETLEYYFTRHNLNFLYGAEATKLFTVRGKRDLDTNSH